MKAEPQSDDELFSGLFSNNPNSPPPPPLLPSSRGSIGAGAGAGSVSVVTALPRQSTNAFAANSSFQNQHQQQQQQQQQQQHQLQHHHQLQQSQSSPIQALLFVHSAFRSNSYMHPPMSMQVASFVAHLLQTPRGHFRTTDPDAPTGTPLDALIKTSMHILEPLMDIWVRIVCRQISTADALGMAKQVIGEDNVGWFQLVLTSNELHEVLPVSLAGVQMPVFNNSISNNMKRKKKKAGEDEDMDPSKKSRSETTSPVMGMSDNDPMQQFGFGGKAQKKKPLLKGEKDPTQIHSAELNDIMQYVGVDLEEEARGLVGASDEEDEVEAPLSEEQMREKRWFINVDNVWNRCQGFAAAHNVSMSAETLEVIKIALQDRLRSVLEDSIQAAKHRTGVYLDHILTDQGGWVVKGDMEVKIIPKLVITDDPKTVLYALEKRDKDLESSQRSKDSTVPSLTAEPVQTRKKEIPDAMRSKLANATALMELGGVSKSWMLDSSSSASVLKNRMKSNNMSHLTTVTKRKEKKGWEIKDGLVRSFYNDVEKKRVTLADLLVALKSEKGRVSERITWGNMVKL